MLNSPDLELAAMALPLEEREELAAVIEESISQEYDRLAQEAVTRDVKRIEQFLKHRPLSPAQIEALQERIVASYGGKGPFPCWDNLSREIVMELRRCG